MIMSDEEFDKTMKEVGDILCSKAVEKVLSHMFSIQQAVLELRASRDRWKAKYKKLKEEMKK